MEPGERSSPLEEILGRASGPSGPAPGAAPPGGGAPHPNPPSRSEGSAGERLLLGKDPAGRPIELPKSLLKRHLVILGASGSGKTVLGKCVLEEAALLGVPAIIIDPQGDLASLAVPGDPAELQVKGTDPARLADLRSRIEVRIFTPASSKGIPLSANPLLLPEPDLPEEEKIRSLDLASSTLTLLLGYDTEVEEGKAVKSLLYAVFEEAWRRGEPHRDFASLARFIEDLPAPLLERTSAVASERDRLKLARNLRYMAVGMNQLLFTFGAPVSVETFLKPVSAGKVPVNVIYLNSLSDDEHKQFFVTMIAREVYGWMLRNPSEDVQLVFYIDEVGPYLPPNPYSPPAKDVLRLLFKQGRKYGVSCLMNTQNAADVDYKAMAQAGTWALGRMMTRQDLEKVKHVLRAMNTADLEGILGALPQLKAGEFVLISPDAYPSAVRMRVRWLLSRHLTLEEEKLRENMDPVMLQHFDGMRGSSPLPARSAGEGGVPAGEAAGTPAAAPPGAASASGPASRPSTVIAGQAGPTGPAPHVRPPDEPPPALHSHAGPVVVYRLKYPQATASNIARKLTAAGLFEKVEVDKGELRYLPLWQLALTVTPTTYMNSFVKMFSKGADRPVEENVYINALNGRLLVIRDRLTFANVASEDPTKIRDLDGQGEFDEHPALPDLADLVPPRIDEKLATALGYKMFGVTASAVKLIFLPVWTFTTRVRDKWVAHVKYIDGALGLEIPEDPFSGL